MDEEFDLTKLEWRELRFLCKFFGVPSFGTHLMLVEALKLKLRSVQKDDAAILREGIDSLSKAELVEASRYRGFSPISGASELQIESAARAFLSDWLQFSNAKVPMCVVDREFHWFSSSSFGSYLHLLLRSVDSDGILFAPASAAAPSATAAPAASMVQDEKKAILPDLVEISLANQAAKPAESSAAQQLQSKIDTMISELETKVGVQVASPAEASGATPRAAAASLTPAALLCAKTVFESFDTNSDSILSANRCSFSLQNAFF